MQDRQKKKKILWSILCALIAAATVWTVTASNRAFSFESFLRFLQTARKGWLLAAMLCACGFIVFEGMAIRAALKPFCGGTPLRHNLVYSAADIYFSAITPSATGGQPAAAVFMIRQGVPATVTAVALLANLVMYTLAIIVVAVLVFCLFPGVFAAFGTVPKILILLGCAMQLLLISLFILLLKSEKTVRKIANAVLRFLCKMRLLRHPAQRQQKLDAAMAEYGAQLTQLRGKRKMLTAVFWYNFLQRASLITVTGFVYLAFGGEIALLPRVWAAQAYAVLGSNSVPIPGAMGISDYLMLEGFGALMPSDLAANLELLSRTLSFYFCIIVCGILVLAAYLLQNRRKKDARIL